MFNIFKIRFIIKIWLVKFMQEIISFLNDFSLVWSMNFEFYISHLKDIWIKKLNHQTAKIFFNWDLIVINSEYSLQIHKHFLYWIKVF